jgi:hypothetical protein
LANTCQKATASLNIKYHPNALGCGIKKLFKKKDGSPNAMGKFFKQNHLLI